MCVAIYKPAGAKIPTEETFRNCFETNPDGCGFMVRRGSEIVIRKGFMKLKNFMKAIKDVKDEDDAAFHFRIATHGGVCEANCHPFPVSKRVKDLQAQNFKARIAVVHNGILPFKPERKDISDTMQMCLLLGRMENGFSENVPAVANLLRPLIGSNKVCIMHPKGTEILGDWKVLDGVYFSNLLWQVRKHSWCIPEWSRDISGGTGYDDDRNDDRENGGVLIRNGHALDTYDLESLACGTCIMCGGDIHNLTCTECGENYSDIPEIVGDAVEEKEESGGYYPPDDQCPGGPCSLCKFKYVCSRENPAVHEKA